MTAIDDPAFESAKALAAAKSARLLTVAEGPFALALLDRADRPLCYRVDGLAGAADPPPDQAALREAFADLANLAAPGDIRIAPGFDPADADLVWLSPYDRRRITPGRAATIAGDILRHRGKTARRSFATGVTSWKRTTLTAFLDGPNGPPVFVSRPEDAAARAKRSSGQMVVWASRRTETAERAAREADVPLSRLEDGFLRSVGLGAAFIRPVSLVLDGAGVYYDPAGPSDLELILRERDIPEAMLARAAALRRRLVDEGATKYNVGAPAARVVPEGRFGVLVPGQVEDDASILRGAGAVRTNRALLAAARARRPDAFIVYKPHPDVVAGYRRGEAVDSECARIADAVVIDGSIAALYPQCRAIETMTSLSGFEGLLRGLEITTHGQPFYAGWGLTEDLAPQPRRGRPRTIEELVAAALILYPLYCDPVTLLPCGPETALDRILEQRAQAATGTGRLRSSFRHAYALTRHRLLGPIARRLS